MLRAARIFPAAIVLLLATVATTLFAQTPSIKDPNASPISTPPINTPLAFEANRGQTAPQVQYLARSREGVVFLTHEGLTVSLPGQGSFRMLFDQGNTAAAMAGEELLIARSNYLGTAKPTVNIENFGAVRYREVYPGIDVRFYGRGLHLEHDFLVAPGADTCRIALRLDGIDRVNLAKSGAVELGLGKVTLAESTPQAWQMVNGRKQTVDASWKVLAGNRLGISVGAYDRRVPLVIDPVLAYSTHLGGTTENDLSLGTSEPAFTIINNIALDSARNVYVSGTTSAIDYPTTAGAFDRTPNTQASFHSDTFTSSGFVSKFDKTGRTLIYSTFLHAGIEKMAVAPDGHVYTAEFADDANPGPNEGGSDPGIFVDKLSLDGSHLLYSLIFARTTNTSTACQTFGDSFPSGLAADNIGHVWMTGSTANPCLPSTPGVVEPTMNPANSAGFLTKLDTTKAPAASVVYTTYVGGQTGANPNGVVVDGSGNAYVAGNGPTTYPHTHDFGTDTTAGEFGTFVTKFNPTAAARVFSTVIHSSLGIAVGIDPSLNVYVAGNAGPGGFPTTNGAFQTTAKGTNCNSANTCLDNFVSKLNPTGSLLLYSTYVGGTGTETLTGLQVNSVGMAFITGNTSSQDYPVTTNAPDKTAAPSGETSAFVTALTSDAKALYYSTYLSGATTNVHSSIKTSANSIFVDPAFNAWVAGATDQSDFPVTANAFQPGIKGSADGFFAELVITGDLKVTLGSNVASVAKNGNVILTGSVLDLGPDGSDAVVFTEAIPAGYKFQGVSTNATSCTKPAAGATSGTVKCTQTRLESGQHFFVNVFVQAIAASGSNITSKATASARTQDLNQANNAASVTVHVK